MVAGRKENAESAVASTYQAACEGGRPGVPGCLGEGTPQRPSHPGGLTQKILMSLTLGAARGWDRRPTDPVFVKLREIDPKSQ